MRTTLLALLMLLIAVPAWADGERTGRSDGAGQSASDNDGGHDLPDWRNNPGGDLNNNGIPDGQDPDYPGHPGQCCKDAPGDYDGDGDVDEADEAHFLW